MGQSVGSLIFEDDYDGEFRYSGRPIPALQGLDHSGCVLYAGSFSKVLFPSLRIAVLLGGTPGGNACGGSEYFQI